MTQTDVSDQTQLRQATARPESPEQAALQRVPARPCTPHRREAQR